MAVVMERHLAEAKLPVDDPDLVSSPISVHMIGLMEKYRPLTKPDISVDVFRERNEANCSPHPLRFWKTDFLPDGGWNHWTRQPSRVHWLDGDHVTILRPPLVSRLAQAIRDRPL
jgi:thioesterase domain-containing protein